MDASLFNRAQGGVAIQLTLGSPQGVRPHLFNDCSQQWDTYCGFEADVWPIALPRFSCQEAALGLRTLAALGEGEHLL